MKVFYAGSFNPFTKGHADILERLLKIAGEVAIGIGVNIEKPETSECARKNEDEIRRYIAEKGLQNRVSVYAYSGLTAEEAIHHDCDCLARGVRTAADFDYENALAAANRDAFGIETILLAADPKYSFVSSTLIRDLEAHGRNDLANRYRTI